MKNFSKKPHTVTRTLPDGAVKTTRYETERDARKYTAYLLVDNSYVATRSEASKAATALVLDTPLTVGKVTLTLSVAA